MSTVAHYRHAPAIEAAPLRNTYTPAQFAAEILGGNLAATWVESQCRQRKIKCVTRKPRLIPQAEAIRFINGGAK